MFESREFNMRRRDEGLEERADAGFWQSSNASWAMPVSTPSKGGQLVGRGGERGDGRAYVASRVGRLVGQ